MQPDDADRVYRHLRRYWERCRSLFVHDDFPLATFCALTLLEEVGKTQMLHYSEQAPAHLRDELDGIIGKGARRDHGKKFWAAVFALASSNWQLSFPHFDVHMRESLKKLYVPNWESLRAKALYMEVKHGKVKFPDEQITVHDSFMMVLRAGQALGAILEPTLGKGEVQKRRLRAEINELRKRYDAKKPPA